MVECREDFGFALKASEAIRIAGHRGGLWLWPGGVSDSGRSVTRDSPLIRPIGWVQGSFWFRVHPAIQYTSRSCAETTLPSYAARTSFRSSSSNEIKAALP